MLCNIGEKCNRRSKFKDLLEFIQQQAAAALDPVFGEAQNSKEKATFTATKSAHKPKGSNFAISVAPVSEQSNGKPQLNWRLKSRPEEKNAHQTRSEEHTSELQSR